MNYTNNKSEEPHLSSGLVDRSNWQSSSVQELLNTSLKYSTGDGVEVDYIMAHVWLNIAATMGSMEAKEQRQQLAQEMTSSEIAQAQRIARELLYSRSQMH